MKTIIYVLLSLGLAYLSIKLVGQISSITRPNLGWSISFIFGLLLNLYVTGTFAFVGFQLSTHKIFPKSYYIVSNPNLILTLHRLLGIKYFNIFLMAFIWGKPGNRKKFFDGSRSGIANLIYQTKQAEFGHMGAFIILSGICFWLIYLGHYKIVLITSIINIIGNLYPALLQRKHRVRIDRMKSILEKRRN